MSPPAPIPGSTPRETANDRFKRRSQSLVWQALAAAAVLHFAAFAFWPEFSAAGPIVDPDPPVVVPLPPPIDVPEPPAPIRPPALPVIAETDVPDDVTIPRTTFEHNPPELLPPPARADDAPGGFEALAPSMTPPRLRNPDQVRATLERNYPPFLRDAGIGGIVNVHIWLDENGTIVHSKIGRSSGHPPLDEAALRVVGIMRFAPATNRDRPVRVIVDLPIEFKAR
jgi:protein TonB